MNDLRACEVSPIDRLREKVKTVLACSQALDAERGLEPSRWAYASTAEIPESQLLAAHAFVRVFESGETMGLKPGTLAEGVNPMSFPGMQAFTKAILSKDASVGPNSGTEVIDNILDLHRGFLHALRERSSVSLKQPEADSAALFSICTDVWYKNIPLDKLLEMPVAPSNIAGVTYADIEARLKTKGHERVETILLDLPPLPESVTAIAHSWIENGDLPGSADQIRTANAGGGHTETLVAVWDALNNKHSAWPAIRSFMHGTTAHALLPFEPLKRVVLDAGGKEDLAEEVYFVQQAHGANYFLNWVLYLADIRPDFVAMEQAHQIPEGSAVSLAKLHDAQTNINKQFFLRIESATQGKTNPKKLQTLLRDLRRSGAELQEAISKVGLYAELQLRLDDITNFEISSMPKWLGIAKNQAGSDAPLAVGARLASIANGYYLHQIPRGEAAAADFVENATQGLASEGVTFNSDLGLWQFNPSVPRESAPG